MLITLDALMFSNVAGLPESTIRNVLDLYNVTRIYSRAGCGGSCRGNGAAPDAVSLISGSSG